MNKPKPYRLTKTEIVHFAISGVMCVMLLVTALSSVNARYERQDRIDQENFVAAPRGIEH